VEGRSHEGARRLSRRELAAPALGREEADESLLDRINEKLAAQDDLLVWRFAEKLDFHLAMPERIETPHAIHIRTKWGQVKITAEALVLAISLGMRGEDVPLRAPRPAAAVVAP